jgi:oligosaccharide repeat unit polymerase
MAVPAATIAARSPESTRAVAFEGGRISASMVAFGVVSLVVLSLGLWEVVTPSANIDDDWELQVSVVSLGWLVIYLLCTYVRYRSVYLFASCYLALLWQFHLGITASDAAGLFTDIHWPGGLGAYWLSLSGWYVIVSFGAFGIGFAVAARRLPMTTRPDRQASRAARLRGLPLAWWAGLGLLAASLATLALAIASVGSLLAYSRVDLFRGVGDTRGLGVFLMAFPSALTLLVIGSKAGWQRTAGFCAAALGLGLVMLSGYRTYALAPLVIGAIVWVKVGRRIPAVLVACGLVLMVLAISFIGVLREAGGAYGSLEESKFERAWSKSSAKETVQLGQTGGLLAQVLRLVPASDPYRYGMTYVHALVDSVPNVMPEINESQRKAAKSRSVIDPDAIERLAPSDWITYRIAREKFDVGQGVGFTTIGEAYLNFGVIGVVAFFLLLGFFFGKLEAIDLVHHPAWLFFCCALLWHLTRTVRDDFGNFTKPVIFILIILAIWRVVGYPLMPRRVRPT